MRDDAYAVPLLPISMVAMTEEAANDIEKNLRYLISLFSLFDAGVRAEAVGSLGYLELTETGTASDAFRIDTAVQVDKFTVTVRGADLAALSWAGDGWVAEVNSPAELRLVYVSEDYWDAEAAQAVLATLQFSASSDLDATLMLTAECVSMMQFDAIGPVNLRFRSGATWALIESQEWDWEGIETAEFDWNGLQALHK